MKRARNDRTHRDDTDGSHGSIEDHRRVSQRVRDALPGIGTTCALAVPAIAVVAASAGRNIHEVLWLGDGSTTGIGLGMVFVAGSVGALAIRHHLTTKKQERDATDIRASLATLTSLDRISRHLVHENERKDAAIAALDHKVSMLTEELSSGGHEVEDVPSIWTPMQGTRWISFNSKLNREADEIVRPDGVEFHASCWAIKNWLPRILCTTALSDWRIVLVVDEVDPALANVGNREAYWVARKYVRVFEDLMAIASRHGTPATLDHVRFSIVRKVRPEHRFRSIHAFTRQTGDGPVPTVVCYHRHTAIGLLTTITARSGCTEMSQSKIIGRGSHQSISIAEFECHTLR